MSSTKLTEPFQILFEVWTAFDEETMIGSGSHRRKGHLDVLNIGYL